MKALSKYYSPTPKKWRKLGDSLLAVSTMVTTYAIAEDMKTFSLIALGIGVVGKFLTNFFTEDDK
jgi:hypothetical protein